MILCSAFGCCHNAHVYVTSVNFVYCDKTAIASIMQIFVKSIVVNKVFAL